MQSTLNRLFVSHPRSVGESYVEHAWFALRFSAMLFAAALAALIHALVPAMFERTASAIVRDLFERTHNRGAAS